MSHFTNKSTSEIRYLSRLQLLLWVLGYWFMARHCWIWVLSTGLLRYRIVGHAFGLEQSSVIESWVPIFVFAILFGLSMDYHVFILTRVKEARDRGLDSRSAVARGIAITSGTITSAATIMVLVFAAFITIPFAFIQELGLGLAVAVLLDATVIRSVLLPATMTLLGDWNWWLPPFLRWLPNVTIEGEPEAELIPDSAAAPSA